MTSEPSDPPGNCHLCGGCARQRPLGRLIHRMSRIRDVDGAAVQVCKYCTHGARESFPSSRPPKAPMRSLHFVLSLVPLYLTAAMVGCSDDGGSGPPDSGPQAVDQCLGTTDQETIYALLPDASVEPGDFVGVLGLVEDCGRGPCLDDVLNGGDVPVCLNTCLDGTAAGPSLRAAETATSRPSSALRRTASSTASAAILCSARAAWRPLSPPAVRLLGASTSTEGTRGEPPNAKLCVRQRGLAEAAGARDEQRSAAG